MSILSLTLTGLLLFFQIPVTEIFIISLLGIFLKLLSLLAITLFFSIFLSNGIATFSTLAVYIIGHSGYALLEYAFLSENIIFENLAKIILFFFPNLLALNFKSLVHTSLPSWSHIILVFLFAIIYILILLFLSRFIFEKKSFDNI